MKKISCRYPPPESRKHKGQTEQTTASRQATSAARSRKVNDKIPHELQGVFSVTLPDVVSSRPLPAVEQLPSPNTIGSSSRIDEPSLDSGYLFSIDEAEFNIPSPMDNSGSADWTNDCTIDGKYPLARACPLLLFTSQLTLNQAAQASAGKAQGPTPCPLWAPNST